MTEHTCYKCRFVGHDNGDDFWSPSWWCTNGKSNKSLPDSETCKHWKCWIIDVRTVADILKYHTFDWTKAKQSPDPAAVIGKTLVQAGVISYEVAKESAENYIATLKQLKIW